MPERHNDVDGAPADLLVQAIARLDHAAPTVPCDLPASEDEFWRFLDNLEDFDENVGSAECVIVSRSRDQMGGLARLASEAPGATARSSSGTGCDDIRQDLSKVQKLRARNRECAARHRQRLKVRKACGASCSV
jgi:hypothetical protein